MSDSYNVTYEIDEECIIIKIIDNVDGTQYYACKKISEYKIYTDMGINIFDFIGQAIDNNFYQLIENHNSVTITISIGKTKIPIQCDILQNEFVSEIDLDTDLKTTFTQITSKIKKLEETVEHLNKKIVELNNKDDHIYFCDKRISKSKKHLIINFTETLVNNYNFIFDNNINKFPKDEKNKITKLFELRALSTNRHGVVIDSRKTFSMSKKKIKNEWNSYKHPEIPYIMGLSELFTTINISTELFQLNLDSLVLNSVQIFNFPLLKEFKGTHLHIIKPCVDVGFHGNYLDDYTSITEDDFFDVIESLTNLKHLTFVQHDCKYNFRPYFFEKMKLLECLTVNDSIQVENLTKRVKVNRIELGQYI